MQYIVIMQREEDLDFEPDVHGPFGSEAQAETFAAQLEEATGEIDIVVRELSSVPVRVMKTESAMTPDDTVEFERRMLELREWGCSNYEARLRAAGELNIELDGTKYTFKVS